MYILKQKSFFIIGWEDVSAVVLNNDCTICFIILICLFCLMHFEIQMLMCLSYVLHVHVLATLMRGATTCHVQRK